MLTKSEFSKLLAPNLKSLENYDWYQDLNFFLPKSRFYAKFTPNLVFPKILTKIDIFDIFDQNQGQNWDYLKILNSIEIFIFFFLNSK